MKINKQLKDGSIESIEQWLSHQVIWSHRNRLRAALTNQVNRIIAIKRKRNSIYAQKLIDSPLFILSLKQTRIDVKRGQLTGRQIPLTWSKNISKIAQYVRLNEPGGLQWQI